MNRFIRLFKDSIIGLYTFLYVILTSIDVVFWLIFGNEIDWLHNLLLSFITILAIMLVRGIIDDEDIEDDDDEDSY